VFACESQPIVVEGLLRLFEREPEFYLAGHAPAVPEALDPIREIQPRIVLVDQSVGLKAVFQFLQDLKSVAPDSHPVLWIHEMAEIDCFRALQGGARGVVRKTDPLRSLLECLRAAAAGSMWIESGMSPDVSGFLQRKHAPRLTPREREIVRHVCGGLKNKQIAEQLSITPGTVKVHLMHIFEKTGVKDRFELAIHGRRLLGAEAGEGDPERAQAHRAGG
jgi:DNA-binding NarL/FixJ family response regulator